MDTATQELEEVTATPGSAARLIREVKARTPQEVLRRRKDPNRVYPPELQAQTSLMFLSIKACLRQS